MPGFKAFKAYSVSLFEAPHASIVFATPPPPQAPAFFSRASLLQSSLHASILFAAGGGFPPPPPFRSPTPPLSGAVQACFTAYKSFLKPIMRALCLRMGRAGLPPPNPPLRFLSPSGLLQSICVFLNPIMRAFESPILFT